MRRFQKSDQGLVLAILPQRLDPRSMSETCR
jgi:hypothetical protein